MNLTGASRRITKAYQRVRKVFVLGARPKSTLTLPVFIVGAHRCGTSMTLQAFAEGDYSVAFEQTDERAFKDHMLREDRHIQSLIYGSRGDVAAFKPLRQNQQIRRYLKVFPRLRVVWMVRDYRAAAASAAAKWSSIHRSFRQMLSTSGATDWRGEGMTVCQMDVLNKLYAPELSLSSAYALFWYLRSSFYLEHELDQQVRVRVFFYEDLVTHPRQTFRKMMDFCECTFDEKVYQHVHLKDVRKPAVDIDDSIAELCEQLCKRMRLQADQAMES